MRFESAVVMALLVAMLAMIIGAVLGRDIGYRQGQIDAINGKVMYELKQLPTGETVWKKASEK